MRKKNSIFNILGSFGAYFIATIFSFITQTFIIRILGIEYSGVNGLFTNIITMLSVAELGLGSTIIFKLYKPISDGDKESIKSWMKFYKICYRYVALIVVLIGLLLIPSIPTIVGNTSINENIIILYIVVLIDTVLSYIMTYKRSLLYAEQKNFVINIVHIGYVLSLNITQIILLYFTHNYLVYLLCKLVYRILENIVINVYVDKHYSYINEPCENISKSEKKDIVNRVKAIFLQKISFVINKGVDNVLISYFLGISIAGLYTNYNLIVLALAGIIYQIVSGFGASVGNLLTEQNNEKNYSVYKKINMFNSYITGMAIVGFCSVIQKFIILWLGDEYLMSNIVVYSFAIYIYSDSIRRSITLFKEAAGICKEDQLMYVLMALINVFASIILCKFLGVSGVILGTALSYLFLIVYSYPKYVFRTIFKKSIIKYYMENLKYLIYIIASVIISIIVISHININNNLIVLAFNGIISIVVANFVFVIMFFKTDEFKFYFDLIVDVIKKIIKKINSKRN